VTSLQRIVREKRSLMLPLLVALAVNVGLLVLAVLPLTQSVASVETRAVEAARERKEAEQAFARAQAMVNGKARAGRELARFYGQVLPANQSGARAISYLTLQQLATKAGLKLASRTTSVRTPDEDGRLTRFATELALTGPYRGIRQFIQAVENQPAFLVIEGLEVASAAGENEPLQVTLTIATYYRERDGG